MILKRVILRFTIHVSDTLLSGSIHTTYACRITHAYASHDATNSYSLGCFIFRENEPTKAFNSELSSCSRPSEIAHAFI